MRRTDLQVADMKTRRMLSKLLREMTPEWRILKALELSALSQTFCFEQTKSAVRRSMRNR